MAKIITKTVEVDKKFVQINLNLELEIGKEYCDTCLECNVLGCEMPIYYFINLPNSLDEKFWIHQVCIDHKNMLGEKINE